MLLSGIFVRVSCLFSTRCIDWCFFTLLSLSFPRVLFKALQNPFAENGGTVVDNLIASTEICTFQTMCILWHKVDKKHGLERSSFSKRQHLVATRQSHRFRKSLAKGQFGETVITCSLRCESKKYKFYVLTCTIMLPCFCQKRIRKINGNRCQLCDA